MPSTYSLILLDGIGVVKAHVAGAAVVTGKAEVQTDALGMADVQIAVRLRREARVRMRAASGSPFSSCSA